MEKIIHSPLLYHLFLCCGENYENFVLQISSQIETEIEDTYAYIYDKVAGRKIKENGVGIIKRDFRKFVINMEEAKEKIEKNEKVRMPKYCMFKFYQAIAKLEGKLTDREYVLQSDIDMIKKFWEVFDYFRGKDVEAINRHRLKELFDSIKDERPLNNDLEKVFAFLLDIGFPGYVDECGCLTDKIKSRSWEEVAFGDLEHWNIIKNTLQDDSKYEQLEKLFEKLKEATNELIISENLHPISELLDDIYTLFRNKNNEDETKTDPIELDLPDGMGAAYLHSHILSFMRWLPIMSADEQQDQIIMESVDNVIGRIEEQIYEIIEKDNNLKKVLAIYPTDCNDIIFMQANSKDLRKLLIDAMYYEPCIRSQFLRYYKRGFCEKEAEGGI